MIDVEVRCLEERHSEFRDVICVSCLERVDHQFADCVVDAVGAVGVEGVVCLHQLVVRDRDGERVRDRDFEVRFRDVRFWIDEAPDVGTTACAILGVSARVR